MSRTNHYCICSDCRSEEDRCERHPKYTLRRGHILLDVPFDAVLGEIPDGHYVRYYYYSVDEPIKLARWIDGRRPWHRKRRWPDYGYKSCHNGPSRWWWQEKHAKVRRVQDREIRRAAADGYDSLSVTKERKLIDLWGWY